MYFKKKGLPEVGEVVLCTVRKILYHSVFVSIEDYEGREGLVHISEVSPGRIRNLRDFVREGKIIVCKVLRVNSQKNQIDLSLRRVNLAQRKNKLEEVAFEKKAEKLLEVFAEQTKRDKVKLIAEIGSKASSGYPSFYECFTDVAETGESILADLGVEKKLAAELAKVIQEKVRKSSVSVSGVLMLRCSAPDGVSVIKNAIIKAKNVVEGVEVSYLGAPRYKVTSESADYKSAEEKLSKIVESVKKDVEKGKGFFEFKKDG